VNHLPWITELTVGGEDGFDALRRPSDDPKMEKFADEDQLKLARRDRYGALPGAGDRHVAEFFPWALTQESEWGKRWGVHLTSIVDREDMAADNRDEGQQVIDGDTPRAAWRA